MVSYAHLVGGIVGFGVLFLNDDVVVMTHILSNGSNNVSASIESCIALVGPFCTQS